MARSTVLGPRFQDSNDRGARSGPGRDRKYNPLFLKPHSPGCRRRGSVYLSTSPRSSVCSAPVLAWLSRLRKRAPSNPGAAGSAPRARSALRRPNGNAGRRSGRHLDRPQRSRRPRRPAASASCPRLHGSGLVTPPGSGGQSLGSCSWYSAESPGELGLSREPRPSHRCLAGVSLSAWIPNVGL